MKKTYRLDRLYFRFLKPKGIDVDQTAPFALRLHEEGFIELFSNGPDDPLPRFVELDKLTKRNHRDELFKILQEFIV